MHGSFSLTHQRTELIKLELTVRVNVVCIKFHGHLPHTDCKRFLLLRHCNVILECFCLLLPARGWAASALRTAIPVRRAGAWPRRRGAWPRNRDHERRTGTVSAFEIIRAASIRNFSSANRPTSLARSLGLLLREMGHCMLAGGGCGTGQFWPGHLLRRQCRKPALDRPARHSLFVRYMKAQLRLAGGRRKPGRHGFSSDTMSDTPRGCRALPYLLGGEGPISHLVGNSDQIRRCA